MKVITKAITLLENETEDVSSVAIPNIKVLETK